MPTTRTPTRRPPRGPSLTPSVVAAWAACDTAALHSALRLKVWNPSPLPTEITALGVDPGEPPDDLPPHRHKGWRIAQKLQAELLKATGWPECREAYQKNLDEALEWQRYCAELAEHPERGGTGTGCDPASRRRQLEDASERVEYRRELLADSRMNDLTAAEGRLTAR